MNKKKFKLQTGIISFDEIVSTHQSRVLNIVYAYLNNKEDSEDITQEVFIEVYKSLDSFHGKSQLSTWIYRIAVNKSIDFIRKNNRKKRFGKSKRIEDFDKIKDKLISKRSNPHFILEKKDHVQLLKMAVHSLSKKQKTAIILNKYDGFSYKEVSEIMQISISAVESLIFKGRKNLRKILFKELKK